MEIMFPKSVDTHKTISRGKARVLTAGVALLTGEDSLTIHPVTKKGGVNQVCVALPYDSKTLFAVAEAIKDQAESVKAKEDAYREFEEEDKQVKCKMDTNELIAFCEKHEGMVVKASRELWNGTREKHLLQYKDSRFTDRLESTGEMLNDSQLKFRIVHASNAHPAPKVWEVTG